MLQKTSILLLFCLLGSFAIAQPRQSTILDRNWKFTKGNPEGAHTSDFDDSGWQDVKVPHDWAIAGPFIKDGDGNTGKLPWKGEGWYRRDLSIPEDLGSKRVFLVFDGVMAFPEVFINGEFAGRWDYGYNSFYLDVTSHVKPGSGNTIAVYANTNKHDSRWYPGAGIYRKVEMHIIPEVHLGIWETYVTTPIIRGDSAIVRVQSKVQNTTDTSKEIRLKYRVVNSDGKRIEDGVILGTVPAKSEKLFEVDLSIMNPRLWDVDSPHIYTVKISLTSGSSEIDQIDENFGIRSIKFTADDGFYLNGRRLQFKGVNLHHDHGPLGAAFNQRAMKRQLEIMKDMGVNAIRNSHNTAAPELLELCDEMGLLFFNEVFDKYDAKAGILDTTDFENFTERNIRNFIKRDRNHPCVFIWSVGNEIGDVQWNKDNGFYRLHTMLNYVDKYDPTRPTTLVCDNLESAKLRHFDYYDVHAWNYGRRYRLARQLEPNKSVIISESASTLSTRGFYEFPLPKEKTDFTKSLQVSSYDLHAPWWAEISDDDFMWQQDEPYIAGEFVWTGFDYLGEPTPYTNEAVKEMGMSDTEAARSSYFGIVDLVGIPKDRYFLYKSYWKPDETTIHILPHWNWEGREGELTPVFVYTNGDCAELFLNGKSQGRRCKDPGSDNSIDRFRLMWKDVKYQPGKLEVRAFQNGNLIGTAEKKTTGPAVKLKLSPDRKYISHNADDLSYILIEALDNDNNPHPLANYEVSIEIEGPAKIAGVGNGNPQSFESFQSNKVKLFNGKAMLIISDDDMNGIATVTAKAEGLKPAKTEITIK